MSSTTTSSTAANLEAAEAEIRTAGLISYHNLDFECKLLKVQNLISKKKTPKLAYEILSSMPDESSKTECDLYMDYKLLMGQFYEYGWGGCPVDLKKAHSCYHECFEIAGDILAGIRSLDIESTGVIDPQWIEKNIVHLLDKCKYITKHATNGGKAVVNKFLKAYVNDFKKSTEDVKADK